MPKDEKREDLKEKLKGTAAAGAGAGALYKSAPHITGRDRLYHGTHSKNMESILKDGIKAKFTGQEGSNTATMKGARPEAFKRSLDKTFAAKSYGSAKGFAAQTEAGGVEKALQNPVKMLKGLNPFKKNVAKIRTPTWKMDTTVNPEVGNATFKEWRKEVDPHGMKPDFNLKSAYKRLKDGTETFIGDIDPKYIKGSDKYQGAGLNEIKEFAKANPKRFAGGLALGGAGLAGLGYAGKKLYDRKKERDMEKDAYVQLGLEKMAEEIPEFWKKKAENNPEVKKLLQQSKDVLNNAPKKELTERGLDWQSRTNQAKPAMAGLLAGGALGGYAGSKANAALGAAGIIGGGLTGANLGANYGHRTSDKKIKKLTQKAQQGNSRAQKRVQRSNKLGEYESIKDRLREIMYEDRTKTSAVDLKSNKAGEYGLGRLYKPNQVAKKSMSGLAGAGIGGFAANKLTKNKENKKRNTLLGAVGGGTVGELARRMKKANVALKGENESLVTSFSPRRDDEMTENLKRLIRQYENDRS
jgi:outer membrane lipoprotein SlyB